jgi:hypothetical protein
VLKIKWASSGYQTCTDHILLHQFAKNGIHRQPEGTLQITVARGTKKSLKIRAAESDTPMQVIVLRALAVPGIQVPNEEILDRRKSK